MDTLLFRVAGLDIHRKYAMACVRITDPVTGEVTEELRRIETLTAHPRELADWLAAKGVTDVALQSRGEFWKPIWRSLEGRFRLLLADKVEAQPIPAYLSYYIESQWLAQLLSRGLLTPSFIPEQARQELHDLIGYRGTLLSDRTRVFQRLHRVLKVNQFKLSNVSPKLLTRATREMLSVLIVGDVDPDALANVAHSRLHSKLRHLTHALVGQVTAHHRFMLEQLLDHLCQLEDQIALLGERIQQEMLTHLLAPSSKALAGMPPESGLLRQVPLLKNLFGCRRFRKTALRQVPPHSQQLEARLVMHASSVAAIGTVHAEVTPHAETAEQDHEDTRLLDAQAALADGSTTSTTSSTSTAAAYSLSSIPQLNSLPGAEASLYLDFDGHFEASWGGKSNITQPAYDIDGDTSTFSDTELSRIRTIWEYVAEDYAPFKINVTTVEPPSFANAAALRVSIGGDGAWLSTSYLGYAFIDAFTNSTTNIAWVFSANAAGDAKAVGNVTSHEAGHAFGLRHQSTYSGSTLVTSYNSGDSARAPIMGSPHAAARGLWWSGTTSSSTTYQDDMAMLSRPTNVFGYRIDDHGNGATTATPLAVSGEQLSGSGIITTTADVDYFSFTTGAGQVTLNVGVPTGWANLDARFELRSATGSLMASADSSTSLGATLTANLAAGSYRIVVGSHGSYGDVGQYTVSGTIVSGTGVNPPTNLVASPVNGGQANLSWADNAGNETGFKVERSTDGTNWSAIATLASNAASFSDTGLSPGVTRQYRVYAFNATAVSDYSNQASITLVPVSPSGLTATAASAGQISLTWTDVSGESSYKVERSLDGVTWTQIASTLGNVVSFQNTGLSANTTYSYRVRATNNGGDSGFSNVASATTLATTSLPTAPSSLVAAAVTKSRVNLTWIDTASNEDGVKIERSSDGGKTWSQLAQVGANITTYSDLSVSARKTYQYRVRAYNTAGNSAYSNVAQVTVPQAALTSQLDEASPVTEALPVSVAPMTFSGLPNRSHLMFEPTVGAVDVRWAKQQHESAEVAAAPDSDGGQLPTELGPKSPAGENSADIDWTTLSDKVFAGLGNTLPGRN